ncbi:HET-domain-containing protein, partial [Sodiomyces alkalinus F11]
MRHWLSYCVDNDPFCSRQTSDVLPRRLLSLGAKYSTRVFLIETRDINNSVRKQGEKNLQYACLSYRWGVSNEEILRTTADNIEAHMDKDRGIVLQQLPQTIIDTVRVCRELGIEYLWVDSLCIIQPRPYTSLDQDREAHEDWVREGSTMDNAYGNSYLTIYAEAAVNCKAGFLGPQDYGKNSWQRISPARAPNAGPDSTVLDGRGWCLQERIMPTRKLRFLGTEMSWECNCRMFCECGHTREVDIDGILSVGRLLMRLGDGERFSHHETWQEVVEDYSWRSVSDPEDNKLMGVAGVARLLLKSTEEDPNGEDEYCAGLWRSDLVDALVWMAVDKRPKQAELEHGMPEWMARRHLMPRTRLASGTPTWSWASINGGIAF